MTTDDGTAGLHHVTAICGDPQSAVDFYAAGLGLRLLKKTVNFDDPGTYHLYFGDEVGHPGTTLTFFAWNELPAGRPGVGQAARVGFRVPEGSLDDWRRRLGEWDVTPGERVRRFGREVLPFRDPEGLGLALVEHGGIDPERQWRDGPVPEEMAIGGFHGVELLVAVADPTAAVLTDVLGLREVAVEDGRTEYAPGRGEDGTTVELVLAPDASPGRVARGSVHHVAYRARDSEHQQELRRRVVEAGLQPTPVIDRYYFESIYFREPGKVLFEVATDGPGFTRDQDPGDLGRGLTLPPWLESRRESIERHLRPVRAPEAGAARGRAGS